MIRHLRRRFSPTTLCGRDVVAVASAISIGAGPNATMPKHALGSYVCGSCRRVLSGEGG